MINIAQMLALRYGGTVEQLKKTERDLGENQQILFVINLNDPTANYHLLSESDLQSLSEATRKVCVSTQTSPFKDLRLIVYKDDKGEVYFKLLHGMASRLIAEMNFLCSCTDLFSDTSLWY